ncbi:MAG: DHH family phosphoesterase, partial [Rickettsiales bacterium]|nr:DHH family phosphoesterase [Rickettsiales bacterium]
MIRKIYCIYHNADFDGIGSAAIVNYYHKELGEKTAVYGWNYGQKIPDYNEFDENGLVYMVDVMLPKEDIVKLIKKFGDNFIFIDHHTSSKEDLKDLKFNSHINTEKAAIENCWDYFYPHL